MKTGKELKMNNSKNYNIVFGSVNNKHPKAIYVNVSAWAEPQCDGECNYNRVIRDINKNVKQSIYNIFDRDTNIDFVKDRTIVDLDIRESGIKFGKRSFMSCEMTLFLNTEIPVNSERMRPMLDNIINEVLDKTFEKNKTFKFYKRKK